MGLVRVEAHVQLAARGVDLLLHRLLAQAVSRRLLNDATRAGIVAFTIHEGLAARRCAFARQDRAGQPTQRTTHLLRQVVTQRAWRDRLHNRCLSSQCRPEDCNESVIVGVGVAAVGGPWSSGWADSRTYCSAQAGKTI